MRAVVIATQPQLLVHVPLGQVERGCGVSGVCRVQAISVVEELGVGVVPLVHLPCGRGGRRASGRGRPKLTARDPPRDTPTGDGAAWPGPPTHRSLSGCHSQTPRMCGRPPEAVPPGAWSLWATGSKVSSRGQRSALPPYHRGHPPHLSWAGWWPGTASHPQTPLASAPGSRPGHEPVSSRPDTGSQWQGRECGRQCSGPPGSGRGTRGWRLCGHRLQCQCPGGRSRAPATPAHPHTLLTNVVDGGGGAAGPTREVLGRGHIPGLAVVPFDVWGDEWGPPGSRELHGWEQAVGVDVDAGGWQPGVRGPPGLGGPGTTLSHHGQSSNLRPQMPNWGGVGWGCRPQ